MAYTKEPVPGRPAAQDGAWTDGVSDGAWTEEYVHGAYTYVGFHKEAKPFTRYTHTNEGVPAAVNAGAGGTGVLMEAGALGILVEPGELGVIDASYTRTLEAQPSWLGTDESIPTTDYTLEAKPTV